MKLLKVLPTLALILLAEISVVHSQQRGDEICETLPSQIHLIKGKKMAGQKYHRKENFKCMDFRGIRRIGPTSANM